MEYNMRRRPTLRGEITTRMRVRIRRRESGDSFTLPSSTPSPEEEKERGMVLSEMNVCVVIVENVRAKSFNLISDYHFSFKSEWS